MEALDDRAETRRRRGPAGARAWRASPRRRASWGKCERIGVEFTGRRRPRPSGRREGGWNPRAGRLRARLRAHRLFPPGHSLGDRFLRGRRGAPLARGRRRGPPSRPGGRSSGAGPGLIPRSRVGVTDERPRTRGRAGLRSFGDCADSRSGRSCLQRGARRWLASGSRPATKSLVGREDHRRQRLAASGVSDREEYCALVRWPRQ